jgi:uncharacterized protein YjbI with pentapeptide repeats
MDERDDRHADLEPFTGALAPEADYDLLSFTGIDISGQDARRARFVDCRLDRVRLDETRLDRAHLVDCTVAGAHGTTVHLRDSVWRGTTLTDCRLGALLGTGARLDDVTVLRGKIDYLTFAGGTLDTVRLEDLTIGEFELGDTTVRRLVVTGCRIDHLDVRGARLREVDLRDAQMAWVEGVADLAGATISEEQAMVLAPALAAHLRITVA